MINLKRVGAHDFCPYFMSDIRCQLGFPRCSWADDKERAPHPINCELHCQFSLRINLGGSCFKIQSSRFLALLKAEASKAPVLQSPTLPSG